MENRGKETPKEIQNQIIEMYKNGVPSSEIKESCRVSQATILKYVKRAGIPIKQSPHPTERKNSHYSTWMLKKYNLSYSDYVALYDLQKGRCAICGTDNGGKKLCVDHCHTTSRVRGLLCSSCNTGIGGLKDSPELMQKAIKYLS